jgi:hypothetical protein
MDSIFSIDIHEKEMLNVGTNFVIENTEKDLVIRTKESIRIYNNRFQLKYDYKFELFDLKQIKDVTNDFFLLREKIDRNWHLSLISYEKGLLWKKESNDDCKIKIVSNLLYFTIKTENLTCHTLSTGSELWRVDLNSFLGNNTHIISNIIDYNEILVFYAKSKEQCSTLCLQQSTGELVKRLDNYGGYYKQYQNCLYFTSAQYQLGILDLDTLQVQVIDFRSILEPKKLEFWYDKFVIDGNDFYFVQNIGAKVARIGIINLILKEIVWLYEFKPQNGQVHDIQLHNNRLYVHTRDNTLHIFEKQENE